MAFYPSDNTPSAATISQGTTEFSNCWVPQVEVGSAVVVAVRAMGFPHPLQLPQPRLRDQVLQPNLVLSAAATKVSSGVTSSSSAVSRNLCATCLAWLRASPCITVFEQMEKLFTVQRSFSGYRLLLNVFCHRELVHTRARLMAGRLESNLALVSTCRRSRPSQALSFAPVQCFERRKLFLGKCIFGICQDK